MALCHFLLYLLCTYAFLPVCYCFPMPPLNTVHPFTCLSYLLLLCHFPMIHPYCSLITFCFIASTFFLSPLLPPTRPSTYPYVDWERHVPEQDEGAARSREGQCALLSSLFCIHHFPPLPNGRACHPWVSGRRGWGPCCPKTRGRWRCSRRGR